MKRNLVFLLIGGFCLVNVLQVKAQQTPQQQRTSQEQRMENERKVQETTDRALWNLGNLKPTEQPKPNRVIKASTTRPRLQINRADLSVYESFLKSPDTGIFKLLPFAECSPFNNTAKAKSSGKSNREESLRQHRCNEENEIIKNFANAYSFRDKKNTSWDLSDIAFEKNFIVGTKSAVQTILVDLGDVALENLTLDSEGMTYLVDFKSGETVEEIMNQYEEIKKGITIGKYKYGKWLSAQENKTFALRSIAYESKATLVGKPDDVIVGFRIIRREEDGTVTILWKELSRKNGIKIKD